MGVASGRPTTAGRYAHSEDASPLTGAAYPEAMSRTVGSRTIDGASSLRCLVVALTPAQETTCRNAIMPVEVVCARNVKDACTVMSTVLPLVVVVDEAISDADRGTLSEMTTACGAEIVTMAATPSGKSFAANLLEALRVAERRRLGLRK